MNRKFQKAADFMLGLLKETHAIGDQSFQRMPQLKGIDAQVILISLEHLGYIRLFSEGNLDGLHYTITEKGFHFISNSSFVEEQKAKDKLNKRDQFKTIREWAALCIAICGLTFTIFVQKNTGVKIANNKLEIDSIKVIVDRSSRTIDSLSKIINDTSTKKKQVNMKKM